MTDFAPQSTDRKRQDTNPLTPRVIAQGSSTATLTAAATGYTATKNFLLPLKASISINNVDAWVKLTISSVDYYYKIGYSEANVSTGALKRASSAVLTVAAEPTSYSLTLLIYEQTLAPSATVTFYYTVYSDKITGGI